MGERGSAVSGKGLGIGQKVAQVISVRRYARRYLRDQCVRMCETGVVYLRSGLTEWAMMQMGGLEMAYKKGKKKKGKGKK